MAFGGTHGLRVGAMLRLASGLYVPESAVPTAPPTISALNYTQGDTLGGGQSISISGSNLTGATGVSFGGSAATFTVVSDTLITATLPAHVAGSVSVTVTSPGGTSNAASFEFWDPSLLTSTTGLWENYTGAPWAARAGSIGGNLAAPATAPTVGTGAGGFTSADTGAATTQYLRSETPNNIEEYITVNDAAANPGPGSTVWALYKPRTAAANNAGAPYLNPGVVCTNAGGYFLMSHSDAGLVCNVYDGTYDEVTAPCTRGTGAGGVGAWHMGVFVYDGANASASIDGSLLSAASVPQGLAASPGLDLYFLQPCSNYASNTPLDGEILAFGTTKGVSTDVDVTKLRNWAKQRFGVTV